METQDVAQKPARTEPAKSTLPQPGRPIPSRAYPGALIVVEGTDGSGKSTQLYLLKRWLEIGGYRLHFTEWNSSPLVKSATRRGKQRRLLTPTTFSLLHAADFADRCERQIMPLLQGDYLVLADRYIYTAFARDTARGCPPHWLRNLYRGAGVSASQHEQHVLYHAAVSSHGNEVDQAVTACETINIVCDLVPATLDHAAGPP